MDGRFFFMGKSTNNSHNVCAIYKGLHTIHHHYNFHFAHDSSLTIKLYIIVNVKVSNILHLPS